MKKIVYPVKTRQELIELIKSMALEIKKNPDAWENKDLPSFLDAMASWVEDMDGFYENTNQQLPAESSWSVIADVLMAARLYE